MLWGFKPLFWTRSKADKNAIQHALDGILFHNEALDGAK